MLLLVTACGASRDESQPHSQADTVSFVEVDYDGRTPDPNLFWDAIMNADEDDIVRSGVRDINPEARGDGIVSLQWPFPCEDARDRSIALIDVIASTSGIEMDLEGLREQAACISYDRHILIGRDHL